MGKSDPERSDNKFIKIFMLPASNEYGPQTLISYTYQNQQNQASQLERHYGVRKLTCQKSYVITRPYILSHITGPCDASTSSLNAASIGTPDLAIKNCRERQRDGPVLNRIDSQQI